MASRQANGPISLDASFDVMYTLCMFFFLFEWVASMLFKTAVHVHWSGDLAIERSIIKAAGFREWFKDLYTQSHFTGYTLSLPWLFDLAFIILTSVNITWVRAHIFTDGEFLLFVQGGINIAIAAPRLVRVIKWIQLLRRNAEQDKQEQHDLKLMGILKHGEVDPTEFVDYVTTQTQVRSCTHPLHPCNAQPPPHP